MVRSVDWKGCTAGLAVSLLLVACNAEPDGGQAEEADGLPDITAADEDAEPEPKPEAEPEPEDPEPDPDGPEAEPEPDPEPAEDPDGYDGFPIDQPVDDISVIDEAYVNEVLTRLEMNYHSLVTRILELGTDGFEDDQVKQASILPNLAQTAVEDLERQMVDTVLLFDTESWFEASPGPASVEVEELLTVRSDCVSAAVHLNAEDLYSVPLSGRWYVGLWPREVMTSEAGTIWRFATRIVDRGEIVDVCT